MFAFSILFTDQGSEFTSNQLYTWYFSLKEIMLIFLFTFYEDVHSFYLNAAVYIMISVALTVKSLKTKHWNILLYLYIELFEISAMKLY